MNDVEAWILRGTIGALIAAGGGVFIRLRNLEAKRAAANERLQALENRSPPDHGEALNEISKSLHDLAQRMARVETKLESRSVDKLWEKHDALDDDTRELGKSLARAKADIAEQRGVLSQISGTMARLDVFLRNASAGGGRP